MKSVKRLLGIFVLLVVAFIFVPNANATNMSAEFKKVLNEKGQFVANIVPPKDASSIEFLVNEFQLYDKGLNFSIDPYTCNSSWTICDMSYNPTGETHTVEVVYNYDEEIKKEVDSLTSDFPVDKDYFMVNDLEVINYWVNILSSSNGNKLLSNYSGELKKYLNHNNLKFDVSVRGGSGGNPFSTERIGVATLSYNDVYYFIDPRMGVKADYVMYVPDETGDTKEEIMAAAQERIDNYLVGDIEVDLSYGGTVKDFYLHTIYEDSKPDWINDFPNLTYEEWLNTISGAFIPAYNSFSDAFNGMFEVEGIEEDDMYFYADVHDEGMGLEYFIIVKKDSSKMVNPSYKSADIDTKIEINTTSNIPLDTFIEASLITEGEEYDKIMGILDVENSLTYDLKLYSDSTEKYITKLENGMFEVKIPLPDNFKGKDLIVYYVDKNGKIEDYDVTLLQDYAVFETDHFSIYTLAELDNNETNTTVNNSNITKNPQTFDGIGNNILFGVVAVIGLLITINYLKKNDIMKS